MRQKGIVHFLLLLTFAILAFGTIGYFAYKNQQIRFNKPTHVTPTPHQTVNWKTYINDKYGFTFKYPNEETYSVNDRVYDLQLGDLHPGCYHLFTMEYCPEDFIKSDSACATYPGSSNLSIYVCNNPEDLLIQKFTYPRKPPDCVLNDPRTKIVESEFVGKSSVSYQYVLDKQSYAGVCKEYGEEYGKYHIQEEIFVVDDNNNHALVISIMRLSEEAKKFFNQILSTFEFLDNEATGNFECPDAKILDCTPCTEDVCPGFFPQYCSKGSALYNFIIENCPGVEMIGLD